MIVPMKKIYLIVQKAHAQQSLEELRDVGVVHVDVETDISSDNIKEISNDIALLEDAVRILENIDTNAEQDNTQHIEYRRQKAEDVVGLVNYIKDLEEKNIKNEVLINRWKEWGDFDPAQVKALEEAGLFVYLCEISKKDIKKIPVDVAVEIVNEKSGMCKCILFSGNKQELPFTCITLPEHRLGDLLKKEKEFQEELQKINKKLSEHTAYISGFKNVLKNKQEEYKKETIAVTMDKDEQLSWLKGFCPIDLVNVVEKKAEEHKWGIIVEDPSDDDKVPTLLRNPKWISIIKPLLDFVGILPGYKEWDINFFLLVFFSMFVGILIGDAGYGLIYMTLFGSMHFFMRKKIKDPTFFKLVYFLCSCIILWGVFTGTYFGQAWIRNTIPPLIPWTVDPRNVQDLCFLLGAIHLSIAHIWRMIILWPSLLVVNEAGWLALIWVMFLAARMFILDIPFPGFGIVLLCVGPVCIYFFSQAGEKKYISSTLGKLFPNTLDMIGIFSDIVSYIRLYAVGLATVAIADAANNMSIGWILILHLINILLAALAILVHALRLNTLEFSKHLGLEWLGFAYEPFKKLTEES